MDDADDRIAHSNSPNTSAPSQKSRSRVSLTSLHTTPLCQRFCSYFNEPERPIQSTARKLAWVTLEGRLVEADTATSAMTIRGSLSGKETLAWELFSPLQRVLLVAVVAAATSESRKAQEIYMLQRSVQLRDQVLQSMQQKLEKLCLQMCPVTDLPSDKEEVHVSADTQFLDASILVSEGWELSASATNVSPCGNGIVSGKNADNQEDVSGANLGREDISKATEMNIPWPEERRMSDLSDFCSSVASHSEHHPCMLGSEQNCSKLRMEYQEKDAFIKELLAATHASDLARQKRIAELEDVIKRKNLVISKLKKDLIFLEQKVIQLARVRRPTYTKAYSQQNSWDLPVMTNNILYDVSSNSSSSDSDSTKKGNGRRQIPTASNDHTEENATKVGRQEPQQSSPITISSGIGSIPERKERQGMRGFLKKKVVTTNAQSVVPSSSNQIIKAQAGKKIGRDVREPKNIVQSRRV